MGAVVLLSVAVVMVVVVAATETHSLLQTLALVVYCCVAGAVAATAAPPQVAMPNMLPLLPLLDWWQQRWQHGIASWGGGALAAASTAIWLHHHRHCCYCYYCPAAGWYAVLPPLLPLLKQWQHQWQSWCGGLRWGSGSSRGVGRQVEKVFLGIISGGNFGPSQVQGIIPIVIMTMAARPRKRSPYKPVKCQHWPTKNMQEQPCRLRKLMPRPRKGLLPKFWHSGQKLSTFVQHLQLSSSHRPYCSAQLFQMLSSAISAEAARPKWRP